MTLQHYYIKRPSLGCKNITIQFLETFIIRAIFAKLFTTLSKQETISQFINRMSERTANSFVDFSFGSDETITSSADGVRDNNIYRRCGLACSRDDHAVIAYGGFGAFGTVTTAH